MAGQSLDLLAGPTVTRQAASDHQVGALQRVLPPGGGVRAPLHRGVQTAAGRIFNDNPLKTERCRLLWIKTEFGRLALDLWTHRFAGQLSRDVQTTKLVTGEGGY